MVLLDRMNRTCKAAGVTQEAGQGDATNLPESGNNMGNADSLARVSTPAIQSAPDTNDGMSSKEMSAQSRLRTGIALMLSSSISNQVGASFGANRDHISTRVSVALIPNPSPRGEGSTGSVIHSSIHD